MRIYFLGIAGAGVSALAALLKSEGHEVMGSDDAAYPPVTTMLDRLAIPYRNRFDAAALPEALDLAVIGASAKLGGAENPELVELRRRGVPCLTFPEFLARHPAERDTIVVTGSFGKSTLTAMLAYLMKAAGRDPGWFIGAAPLDLDTPGHSGRDPQIVLEGDEYVVSPEDRRSKFHLYTARTLLISSLTHDHFNMFPTFESYCAAFERLIAQTPPEAPIFAARGYPALQAMLAGRANVTWYGLEPGEGWSAEAIAIAEKTAFTLTGPAGERLRLSTQLLGLHNIENLVGASALLLTRGLITPEALIEAAPRFRGVARRLDKKTVRSRAPVYEGFGSSLEKARSAIEAIQLHFPNRRLLVVFEPHAFSWRNLEALTWYDQVFAGVSEVLLLPPPLHGADRHGQIDQSEITARVRAAGVACTPVVNAEETLAALERTMTGEEVVLLLSSGPLDGLPARLPAWADARFG